MLPSKFKLKGKVFFLRLELEGRVYQSKSFGLAVYKRNDQLDSKFAVVVSTKISKKAVIRNFIKRTIFDCLRKKITDIKKGLDVAFLIKPSIVNLSKEKLEKEVYESIAKNL